jgi:mannose-1-phosphate guanylyltransferase/mannose-6-phosphate isomerase
VHSIQPVILCGGSGTRLWPLSRKDFPKQFVPLVGGKSLLALTLERLGALAGASGVLCVGSEAHRFMVRQELRQAGVSGRIILEPVARNTAAAMALAALSGDAERMLLFCPSDHHIPDAAGFASMVAGAVPCAAQGTIVTFGVQPTFPSTAYGYIEKGEPRPDGGFAVRRFIEKPGHESAQSLLLSGQVLWNAGIFLCKAAVIVAALEQHAPDILAQCQLAMDGRKDDSEFVRPALEPLLDCRSESIDYAVMERHESVAVFPFAGQWSDVGSWNAVADLQPSDTAGNRLEGQALALESSGNYIHAPHRLVVALGVQDLVVVDTQDAILIAHRASAEKVRAVVSELEKQGSPQAVTHRKVSRPWGSYDSIESGPRFQVKRIVVNPGASLSLQKHFHRAEHWIVVRGTAEVTRGNDTFLLTENQSTYIPLGETHRLRNPGKTPLEMIEVQSGSYLGEDDIVRLDDKYGRVVVPIAGTGSKQEE